MRVHDKFLFLSPSLSLLHVFFPPPFAAFYPWPSIYLSPISLGQTAGSGARETIDRAPSAFGELPSALRPQGVLQTLTPFVTSDTCEDTLPRSRVFFDAPKFASLKIRETIEVFASTNASGARLNRERFRTRRQKKPWIGPCRHCICEGLCLHR